VKSAIAGAPDGGPAELCRSSVVEQPECGELGYFLRGDPAPVRLERGGAQHGVGVRLGPGDERFTVGGADRLRRRRRGGLQGSHFSMSHPCAAPDTADGKLFRTPRTCGARVPTMNDSTAAECC